MLQRALAVGVFLLAAFVCNLSVSAAEKAAAASPPVQPAVEKAATKKATAEKTAAEKTAVAGEPMVLDLTRFYNTPPGKNFVLEAFTGRQTVDGLPFEIGRQIRLWGQTIAERNPKSNLPQTLSGIGVGRTFDELDLIHHAMWPDVEGQTVAYVCLNYADNTKFVFAVRYGVHLRDWSFLPSYEKDLPTDLDTKICWRRPPAYYKAPIRLFKTRLTNPTPQKAVETIDVISARNLATYTLLAATVANRDPARPVTPAPRSKEPKRDFNGKLDIEVFDEATGEPVKGALVDPGMNVEDEGVVGMPVYTSAAGTATIRYRVEQTDALSVTIRKEGYLPQHYSWSRTIPGTFSVALLTVQKPAAAQAKPPRSSSKTKTPQTDLVGPWNAVSMCQSGQRLPANDTRKLQLVFAEKTVALRAGAALIAETPYTVDAKAAPATIDMTFNGQVTSGIYERSGNQLRICLNEVGKGRPKAIPAEFGAGCGVDILLRRASKAPATKEPATKEPATKAPAGKEPARKDDKQAARQTPSASADKPKTPPPFPDEPAAHALYDQAIAAMRKARSLSYVSHYTWGTKGGAKEDRTLGDCTYRAWLKKPNFFRVEAESNMAAKAAARSGWLEAGRLVDRVVTQVRRLFPQLPAAPAAESPPAAGAAAKKRGGVLIGDGRDLWLYWPEGRPHFSSEDSAAYQKTRLSSYMTKPAGLGRHSIGHETGLLGAGMSMPVIDPSTFHGYTDSLQAYLDGVRSLGTEEVDGQPCDKIELSIMRHQRSWFLWLSQADHLPRKLEQIVRVKYDIVTQEQWTSVTVDGEIDDAMFSWKPPEGWTEWRLPEAEERLLKPGTKAPDFELASADGTPIKLADYRNQVVWFYIWRAG